MSIGLMSLVWKSRIDGARKRLVLLALADAANDEGACWPSVETIGRKAGCAVSTARGILAELEAEGILTREVRRRKGDGGQTSNMITLMIDKLSDLGTETPPAGNSAGGPAGESAPPPPETRRPKKNPHENPQMEPTSSSSSEDDGLFEPPAGTPRPKSAEALEAEFDAWWPAYPRKVGKGAALRAWKTARKRVEVREITDGLRAAVQAWEKNRTETHYIPHPASWLNAQRWLDDPSAIGGGGTSPARRSMPGPGVVHTQEEIAQQERAFAAMPAATMLTPDEAEALMQELENTL